jgi:hypothetical protein
MFDVEVCMALSQMHMQTAMAVLNQIDQTDKSRGVNAVALIKNTIQQFAGN